MYLVNANKNDIVFLTFLKKYVIKMYLYFK